jgi:hypothetical protein
MRHRLLSNQSASMVQYAGLWDWGQRGKIAASFGGLMNSAWSKILLLLCAALTAVAASAADEDWYYQTYVDVGYAASNREPSDNDWRSKGTTNILNKPELFLAMA